MHKIDSNGATVDFKFTEGNANLAIPATIVSAAWLNAVQAELVTIIEALGFTLNTSPSDSGDQVYNALLELHKLGGRPVAIEQAIANNQSSGVDVADFPEFDVDDFEMIEFLYNCVRKTASGQIIESGRGYLTWDPTNSVWLVSLLSVHNSEDNIEFLATVVTGNNYKLQYKSSNLAGSSYVGTLKITDLKMIKA